MDSTTIPIIQTHQAYLSQSNPEIRIYYQECHPPTTSRPKGAVLLVHGFPETSHQFRNVIQPLAAAGYHIIAPDYRGHGFSSKPLIEPERGFTKKVISADLHTLVREHVGIKEPIHIMGHDIGGMIVHAYAAQFPNDVKSVTWGECPLPGSSFFDRVRHERSMWHFDFQSHHPDIAVDLVKGKKRMYIKHFYDRLGNKAEVFTPEVLDFYEQVYSMPDAMRCSFLSYRAFEQDKRDNLEWKEKGKSKVRCCVLSGEKSFLGTAAKDMGYEFYENLEVRTVEGSGHWCAEENPKGFVKEILGFIEADAPN